MNGNGSSETIKAIAEALLKVQATTLVALKQKENTHLKSKYADLSAVWDACRESLQTNSIAVIQMPKPYERGVSLVTVLVHAPSAEWIASELTMALEKVNPQTVGSAITYARRYALAAMVGIIAETDDDAEAAMSRGRDGGRRHDPPDRRHDDRRDDRRDERSRDNGQRNGNARTPEEDRDEVFAMIDSCVSEHDVDGVKRQLIKWIPRDHKYRPEVVDRLTRKHAAVTGRSARAS